MPDLTGRSAIVTGANSGLGFETAQGLARSGASVTLAVRDVAKGERSPEAMLPQRRVSTCGGWTSPILTRFGLSRIPGPEHPQGLDLLINNAGIMAIPRRESAEGLEMQFATNHLGHFALTGLLLPALVAVPNSRVVTVSSLAHRMVQDQFR